MKTLMTMKWVNEHIEDEHLLIADCRFNLQDPKEGHRQYGESHIPGAIYFDLEKDLSRQVTKHGGRHPLPDVKDLAFKLGNAGVDHRKTVVAYDDQGGAMASRFWWLLKYFGHENIYVMDEGFSAWQAMNYPVEAQKPTAHPTQFVPQIQKDMIVTQLDINKQLEGKGGTTLIDSRETPRYLGVTEPIDKKAGHIPGAENWFWKENLTKGGRWKTSEELADRFNSLKGSGTLTVYCGSGVTACANILGLQSAGFSDVKLYPGSWSDWISYDDNPIAKEMDK